MLSFSIFLILCLGVWVAFWLHYDDNNAKHCSGMSWCDGTESVFHSH